MPYYWNGYNAGSALWGFLFSALMLLLVMLGVVVAIRFLSRATNTPHDNQALDILRRRYAQGEIDKQEYEQKLQDLQH